MNQPESRPNRRQFLRVAAGLAVVASGCGSTGSDVPVDVAVEEADAGGLRLISALQGGELQASAPDDLVILDVRTPEEISKGHLDGAIMIDFYEADFADRIAALDKDAQYMVYCHSGGRSGETLKMMGDLGFTNVADIDGGIVAWDSAGLPTVTP